LNIAFQLLGGTNMSKIRTGIVSTSWWADAMHVPAIKSHPQAELVACCGRNVEGTKAFADKHDIPQRYTDYREMIANAGLDAIVIATPETSHHDITIAAAEARLHLVCEKPMAMNVAQAKAMVSAVEAAGVKHMMYFTWRWVPWLRYAKQLVEDGYVGRVFESRFAFAGGYGLGKEYHWKWDRQLGLGALGDGASHMVDLAHWLAGPIADVDASVVNFVECPGPDGGRMEPSNDSALLRVHYEDGSHGAVEGSAVSRLGSRNITWEVALRGERGQIVVTGDVNSWHIWGVREDEEGGPLEIPGELLVGVDKDATFIDQVDQIFTRQPVGFRLFIDSILEDRALEPSLVDGYRVQRVLETALESSRSGQRLSVAEVCGPA
jgi:predicted dehydrogenase